MRVINDLRPVEALYLLNYAEEENMHLGNSLEAILVYLANKGYVQAKDNDIFLTGKGKTNRTGLRQYEVNCLDAIARQKDEHLIRIVNKFNFGELMTQQGFFIKPKNKEEKRIFKQTHSKYLPTEKYYQAIKELDELKEEILSAIEEKRKDEYLISMSFAFPTSGLCYQYLDYPIVGVDSGCAAVSAALAAVAASTII